MKRKTVLWLVAIFALLFAVSIWKNVSAVKEMDHMEAVMTAQTYHLLFTISDQLEHIVSVPGARPLDEQPAISSSIFPTCSTNCTPPRRSTPLVSKPPEVETVIPVCVIFNISPIPSLAVGGKPTALYVMVS